MADEIKQSDPAKIEQTLAEVNALRATLAELSDKFNSRGKRNKYEQALKDYESFDLPVMELPVTKFTNKSEASMQQQFKAVATEMKLTWEPSVVFHNGAKFLVNFDAENVEQKLEQYILKHTGISKSDLREITKGL